MPETAISTPEHTASVTRMTLGITSARGDAAEPSWSCGPCSCMCCAFEDE
jgi:hypothetical protein